MGHDDPAAAWQFRKRADGVSRCLRVQRPRCGARFPAAARARGIGGAPVNPIPYTVERRPDTGMNNVKLGVWLFPAAEGNAFRRLLPAYFMLRAGMPAWTPL